MWGARPRRPGKFLLAPATGGGYPRAVRFPSSPSSFLAPWLVVLAGAVGAAQPVPAGTPVGAGTALETELEGQGLSGRVGWETVGTQRELVARLGEWSGRGEQVAPGRYRFVLHRTVAAQIGASQALRGLSAPNETRTETMELLVDRRQGFRAALRKDGKVLSRVRKPSPPQVGEPPELLRRTWWGTLPVAAWGTSRALWDFFKPGSRAFEELRGEASRADTDALKRALEEFTPKPWGPHEIYTAAREQSLDDRSALELAFAFTVDQSWEQRPLQGIEKGEPLHDKYEHYFASAIMAHRSNAAGSFFVGWLKEVGDSMGTGYSEPDLMADALGAEFGESLAAGQVLDHGSRYPLY